MEKFNHVLAFARNNQLMDKLAFQNVLSLKEELTHTALNSDSPKKEKSARINVSEDESWDSNVIRSNSVSNTRKRKCLCSLVLKSV